MLIHRECPRLADSQGEPARDSKEKEGLREREKEENAKHKKEKMTHPPTDASVM